MKYTILPNGNLRIQLSSNADREWVKEAVEAHPNDTSFLGELLEHTGWQANGIFTQIQPIDIGALTDSPLLASDASPDDAGGMNVPDSSKVWYYNDYALRHFGEVMLDRGGVVFHCA